MFTLAKYDGVLGMGYQSIAVNFLKPWFNQAYEQGLVLRNQFSFWINPQHQLEHEPGGKIFLGGVNSNYFRGKVITITLHFNENQNLHCKNEKTEFAPKCKQYTVYYRDWIFIKVLACVLHIHVFRPTWDVTEVAVASGTFTWIPESIFFESNTFPQEQLCEKYQKRSEFLNLIWISIEVKDLSSSFKLIWPLILGNLICAPVSKKGYWQIWMDGVDVTGFNLVLCRAGCQTIVDSGTSDIIGPYRETNQINKVTFEKIK